MPPTHARTHASNYSEFIKVSKDIAGLENEMLELKSVLEEWKTIPEGLEIEQSFDVNSVNNASSSGSNSRNRRNSLADLQALYKTQLEALWESVEGSQRFLPVIPGRHILGRFNGWVELNSATYRPRTPVILVLLNDALLVAVEKRRQMGGAVRVVADKCFHLNEIAVTDLKDAGDLTNAIRIKRDREVHIFRTEKADEKRSLLSAFKKILEETMSRRRKESVWEAEHRRDTTFGGGVGGANSGTSALSSRRFASAGDIGDGTYTKHPLTGFQPSLVFPFIASDDPTGKDLSWIDDVSDQLAVHIALREFEEAVALIEKAKSILPKIEADPLALNLLRGKIEVRSTELVDVLLVCLADTGIRKTGVVRYSGWLLRLGQGERARETFLRGRGELLKKRTGDIHFSDPLVPPPGSRKSSRAGLEDGEADLPDAHALPSPTARAIQEKHLVDEVAELAFVCFTLVRNTCEWYMAAYKDHQTASGACSLCSTSH